MTIQDFTNKALQKISELGEKIVSDIVEANDYQPELRRLLDLSDFVEALNDPLNDWDDNFINNTMEYYSELNNFDQLAVVDWLGYSYNVGLGSSGNGVIGADGRGIESVAVVDGDLIITYDDGSQQNAGPIGVGANLFVVGVEALTPGKSVSITYDTNTIGQAIVDSVATDDTQLRIYILWDGGKEWNGTMVAESTVFTNTNRVSLLSRMFTADEVVDVTGLSEVTIAGNGGSTLLPITQLAVVPTIEDISFGAYPITRGISQTELKDADQIRLILTLSDSSNVSAIEVQNSGSEAFLAEEIAVTDIGNNQVQCFVTADHNILTPSSKGIKLKLKTFTGSLGDEYDSTGVAEAIMNNTVPDLTFNSITYPATQSALKASETADVSVTATGYDEIDYQDTIGQLSIPNVSTYEQVKTVTRIDGQYNVTLENYTIVAYRNANGSQSILALIIQIANADPIIDIVSPAARLISGGNDGTSAQNHIITVQADQILDSNPTLGANNGTLQADMIDDGSMTEFYETLQVADGDTKGNGTFTISATNLAGKVVTLITSGDTYVLGGFILRRKYFAAFTDEVQMGVDVVDTAKLNAWDKDLIPMTYVADQNDSVREYTIVTDDIIHWNDLAAIANNTTGLSFIEIEEVP